MWYKCSAIATIDAYPLDLLWLHSNQVLPFGRPVPWMARRFYGSKIEITHFRFEKKCINTIANECCLTANCMLCFVVCTLPGFVSSASWVLHTLWYPYPSCSRNWRNCSFDNWGKYIRQYFPLHIAEYPHNDHGTSLDICRSKYKTEIHRMVDGINRIALECHVHVCIRCIWIPIDLLIHLQ